MAFNSSMRLVNSRNYCPIWCFVHSFW